MRLMHESVSQRMVEAIENYDDKTASALFRTGLDPNAEKGDSAFQLFENARLLHWTARLGASKCAEVRLSSSAIWTC